jgi:uncharacterized protein YodC (DUF2158 family)
MASQFQEGDIVRLKSDGPKMTVKSATGGPNGNVVCQWFAGKKLEQGFFSPETLVPVEDDEADGKK